MVITAWNYICTFNDILQMVWQGMTGLASVWAMARRSPIWRIWAWRGWRLSGRWPDGGLSEVFNYGWNRTTDLIPFIPESPPFTRWRWVHPRLLTTRPTLTDTWQRLHTPSHDIRYYSIDLLDEFLRECSGEWPLDCHKDVLRISIVYRLTDRRWLTEIVIQQYFLVFPTGLQILIFHQISI